MDTPGYPKAPHSTPSSTHGHHTGLFNLKRPRPPVQNPFDKFSQHDFDAWIGKLTGDLEKALGYEEVIQSQPSLPQAAEHTDDGYDDSDSYVEDSFAEVKARRVLDKGKARDPREGPGLGPKSGDVEQPIEILSDEESEDEGEQLVDFEGSAEGEPDESYEEAKEDGGVDEMGRGEDGSDVETEIWSQRRRRIQNTAGESTRRPIRDDSEVVESEGSGSDEYEDEEEEEADDRGFVHAQGSKGVIQLSSDEEAGTARRRRRQKEELEEEAFLSEEDAGGVDSSPAPARRQLNRQELQDEEMQPSDEDTSFPPHSVNLPSDIRDPWAPVAKYAEDYYSGGNVVSDSRVRLSPHHLSNEDDSGFLTPDVVNPDIGVKEEEEEEEEEEGEEEGEDEFEDRFVKDDPEDMETQDFGPEPDENDHLFNRLRSYTQPNPAVYSPWRGPRTSFIVLGPGSNEEPIMIDSDDELEESTGHHSKVITSDVGHSEEVIFTLEAQDKGRSLQSTDEQSSTRAMEHFLEVPLPRIASESSIVPEVPGPVRADTATINDNSGVPVAADYVPDTPKDPGLHTHGSVDTLSPIPDLKYPDSTLASPSESNPPTAIGDDVSRALDQMAGELEVASHVTTDTSAELDRSGQDTVVREVDEELDELDELDDGPWPLMTSDLDYPHDSQSADVKDGSERDSAEHSETMSNDGNTFSSPTSEVENAEQESSPGIHIFVEEADEAPGTSFEPITINIQPPTPLIMPELDFQVTPTSLNETGSFDNVRSELSEPVLQLPTEKVVLKEATTQHIDTGIHDNVGTLDQGSIFVEKTLQTDGMAEDIEEVKTTDIVTPGDQESMYVVEEPVIGSEFDEVRHDRDISIDIASAVSDDMISTVENGHVEEVLSDTNIEEIKAATYSEGEMEGVHVEEMHSFTGVRELDIEEVTVTTTVEVPVVARVTPESIEEDYFARPSTPIMPSANLDDRDVTPTASGTLPSIIQLPDTPQRVLSPGSTLVPGPTPVSIAVDPGILKVLKENPSFFSTTSSPTPISEHLCQNLDAGMAGSEIKLSNIENTVTQQPSFPQPPSFETSNRMHPDSLEQLPTNYPSFLPVTTTIKPVLYIDPYPYSLSTPLLYSHQEEDGYEDATDHDNSFSPSLNEKELDGNANNYVPALESSGPGEEAFNLTEVAHSAQIDNSKTEQSWVEVEAEADALIDEFLVDEPESDTDADGEADPDFTAPVSSGSARTSEELKEKGSEGQALLTTNASEMSEAAVKEVGSKEEVKVDVGTQEDARDVQVNVDELGNSFKSIGHNISKNPLEALDVERTEEKNEKGIAEATEAHPLDSKTVLISETPVEIPVAETVRMSLSPQVHPLRNTSPGGAPFTSAGERITSTPPSQTHVIQNDSPLDVNTGLIDSSQRKEPSSNLPLEQTENTQARSLVTLPRIKTEGIPPTAQEGSPRRVQVSLEDPYNADNDTDREQRSNVGRAGKRKRSLSVVSNGESPIAPRSTSIAKGKGKTSRQSSKGTSRPRKRPSFLSSSVVSRSPSVASTAVSDVSSLLSPSYPSLPSTDPRPFIHAHSRRKLGNAPRTVQQQRHKQQRKAIPGFRAQDGVLRAENVLTKAPSGLSVPGSSPMTRSHCRYHKISIPKTENGPRIHFLVPGCSLNDAELIEEEEIEDLGEAIIRGDTVIADKIETINFEPYLLWAMRQLVGTELLRENEVYYLPEPNETVVRTIQESKKKGARPSKRQSKRADEDIAGPSQKPAPPLPSDISSIGSAASALRQVIAGLDDDDMSSITETEEEEVSLLGPQKNERGQDPPREPDVSPSKSEASTTSRKRTIRRLGQDAAAYYPSSGEESVSDFSDTTRKSARSRGVKRPRASESSVAGAEGREVKKTKRQLSSSPSLSHAETTQHVLQRSPSHPDHLTEIRPTSPATIINAA